MGNQSNCDAALKRHRVVKGSESGHCCFEATVIDTAKEVAGHPDWVCECFDLSRAHAIADAMNAADEEPLSEKVPDPVFQDGCGKEFDVLSALVYFPLGSSPFVVWPSQIITDANTGKWEMCAQTLDSNRSYWIEGSMFKQHTLLLKLDATSEEFLAAF